MRREPDLHLARGPARAGLGSAADATGPGPTGPRCDTVGEHAHASSAPAEHLLAQSVAERVPTARALVQARPARIAIEVDRPEACVAPVSRGQLAVPSRWRPSACDSSGGRLTPKHPRPWRAGPNTARHRAAGRPPSSTFERPSRPNCATARTVWPYWRSRHASGRIHRLLRPHRGSGTSTSPRSRSSSSVEPTARGTQPKPARPRNSGSRNSKDSAVVDHPSVERLLAGRPRQADSSGAARSESSTAVTAGSRARSLPTSPPVTPFLIAASPHDHSGSRSVHGSGSSVQLVSNRDRIEAHLRDRWLQRP